ncbi:hypothetical protein GGH94_001372 [Coemansia aciculifera]|uniref:Uncharacterized protein n=1 Tax=Coemansia aciculifera TaxID=417176 RepID=A0A9W8ISN2_9FUNG|nr:hypothetical protein GGH94_001372 [Coemansia aciculifera]KAJ2870957.1 hypothetical protein GGH93_005186 [Coemansia aciculifera]
MAILVFKRGASTVFHSDQIDTESNGTQDVEELAVKKYKTKFGHGSSEPSVYAVDLDNSVKKLTKSNSKISSSTEFVCVAVDDVVQCYLDSGSLHSHLKSCLAVHRKSE